MEAAVGERLILVYVPLARKNELRKAWNKGHLEIAKTNDGFWLKGLQEGDEVNFRAIVDSKLYEKRENYIYSIGKRVPEALAPSDLLWKKIQESVKIELPSFNENLFEVSGNISAELHATASEKELSASLLNRDEIYAYFNQIDASFIKSSSWCLIGDNQVFVISKTSFNLPSKRFWKYENLFIPVGFDFSSELTLEIVKSSIAEDSNEYIIANQDGGFHRVNKDCFVPLTRSSVKMSLTKK